MYTHTYDAVTLSTILAAYSAEEWLCRPPHSALRPLQTKLEAKHFPPVSSPP